MVNIWNFIFKPYRLFPMSDIFTAYNKFSFGLRFIWLHLMTSAFIRYFCCQFMAFIFAPIFCVTWAYIYIWVCEDPQRSHSNKQPDFFCADNVVTLHWPMFIPIPIGLQSARWTVHPASVKTSAHAVIPATFCFGANVKAAARMGCPLTQHYENAQVQRFCRSTWTWLKCGFPVVS